MPSDNSIERSNSLARVILQRSFYVSREVRACSMRWRDLRNDQETTGHALRGCNKRLVFWSLWAIRICCVSRTLLMRKTVCFWSLSLLRKGSCSTALLWGKIWQSKRREKCLCNCFKGWSIWWASYNLRYPCLLTFPAWTKYRAPWHKAREYTTRRQTVNGKDCGFWIG